VIQKESQIDKLRNLKERIIFIFNKYKEQNAILLKMN